MLLRLAQRDSDVDLLTVLRIARDHDMEVTVSGSASGDEEPPRPEVPYSVIWFDDDLPEYGRIGAGMVGCSFASGRTALVDILTEESWTTRRAEQVDDPHAEEMLMRWSPRSGWLNRHVVFISEPTPFRFLINWCTTGFRPREPGQRQVAGSPRGST